MIIYMYSPNIEKVCGLCVNAKNEKGTNEYVSCSIHGGYMRKSRDACDKFRYDIFKKKVCRHKSPIHKSFDPNLFKL